MRRICVALLVLVRSEDDFFREPMQVKIPSKSFFELEDDVFRTELAQMDQEDDFAEDETRNTLLRIQEADKERMKNAAESFLTYREFTPEEKRHIDQDPYFMMDRSYRSYVNVPVIEMGFWHALIRSFFKLKKRMATQRKNVYAEFISNRRLMMQLRSVLESGCDAMKGGKDESSDDFDLEQYRISQDARLLAWGMLTAMPIYNYLDHNWDSQGASSTSGKVLEIKPNPVHNSRRSTIGNLGIPRPLNWGNLDYFDYLKKALDRLDQIHPLDRKLAPLYRLFQPSAVKKSDFRQEELRTWTPTGEIQPVIEKLYYCVREKQ